MRGFTNIGWLLAFGGFCATAYATEEIADTVDPSECELGTIHEIQPADAIRERITGRDAWIFSETLMYQWEAASVEKLDALLLMGGADVWGGNVAFMVKDECILGYKFVTLLELIHGDAIVRLFGTEPSLLSKNHLDEATLAELAAAGNPVAEFHAGLVAAWGRGGKHDRKVSIDWLQRAADKGYEPAILALGMSLSGPYVIQDSVTFVGEPPPSDEFTDRVQACYWLFAAGDAADPVVSAAGRMNFNQNWDILTPAQQTQCRNLLRSQ